MTWDTLSYVQIVQSHWSVLWEDLLLRRSPVTGATGFLGAFLLHALVQKLDREGAPTEAKVLCLVRAAGVTAAQHRLVAALAEYGLWTDGVSKRVEAFAGDVTAPRLGLQQEAYALLAARVGWAIHCAAQVSSALPYVALREPNVVGTRHAIAFCSVAAAHLFFVSTLGFTQPSQLESHDLPTAHLPTRSGYAQSKFVAERLVHAAATRLPRFCRASVFRPGVICGHSMSGAANPLDAVNLLFSGLINERVVCTQPRSPIPCSFNLCPIDCVAGAIVQIVADCGLVRGAVANVASASGTVPVFHFCAPSLLSLTTLCTWARAAGYRMEEVSPEEFCRRIRGVVQERHPLFSLKHTLEQPRPATPTPPHALPMASNALHLIEKGGWPCNLSEGAFSRTLVYLRTRGLITVDAERQR